MHTLVVSRVMFKKAKEYCSMQMAIIMKESGGMGNKMVLEFCSTLMEMCLKDNSETMK
jgi:hypothetical protein